ncbi:MAG TPA: hypothetical protein VEL28_19150 [Candidatus Binatia bacterium]|nr:hypothetical protein [Candidatus Binatia bacterium]
MSEQRTDAHRRRDALLGLGVFCLLAVLAAGVCAWVVMRAG